MDAVVAQDSRARQGRVDGMVVELKDQVGDGLVHFGPHGFFRMAQFHQHGRDDGFVVPNLGLDRALVERSKDRISERSLDRLDDFIQPFFGDRFHLPVTAGTMGGCRQGPRLDLAKLCRKVGAHVSTLAMIQRVD